MKSKQVDRYCGQHVVVTFKCDWFNDALQTWILKGEKYTGILKHCPCKGYYQLEGVDVLPTDCACWSANIMKRIRE